MILYCHNDIQITNQIVGALNIIGPGIIGIIGVGRGIG